MSDLIIVKHNVEMAHRLYEPEGKCQQVHGHSWWVNLAIKGEVDETGMVAEFGAVKKEFRGYLDGRYDHKTIIANEDPLMHDLVDIGFPGLEVVHYNPTTENFARDIYEWAQDRFGTDLQYLVEVWETAVNAAVHGDWS